MTGAFSELLIHGTKHPIYKKRSKEASQQPQGDDPHLGRLTKECNAKTVDTFPKTHQKGTLVVKYTAGNSVAGAFETVHGLSSEAGPGCWALGRDNDSLVFTLFNDGHSRRCGLGLSSIHVHLFLGALSGPLVAKFNLTLPLGVEEAVPENEEGLGEIRLDSPALMVNIVISGIVGGEVLQRVPGESVSTVVIDGLDSRAGEEPHGLAVGHTGNKEADTCTSGIQKETLNGVIVESTESVGDVEAMVTRVERH
jgi:hypothetical protein